MHQIVVSRVIEAPPARVWEVLTDLDHVAETLSGVSAVEVMTDGPWALGTRWRETRKVFGKDHTEEMWVTGNDPLRRTEVRASSGGADYVSEFVLAPLDEESRTELTARFGAEMTSPSRLQKLVLAAFRGMAERSTRKALEQDLADIAAAAEA